MEPHSIFQWNWQKSDLDHTMTKLKVRLLLLRGRQGIKSTKRAGQYPDNYYVGIMTTPSPQ